MSNIFDFDDDNDENSGGAVAVKEEKQRKHCECKILPVIYIRDFQNCKLRPNKMPFCPETQTEKYTDVYMEYFSCYTFL